MVTVRRRSWAALGLTIAIVGCGGAPASPGSPTPTPASPTLPASAGTLPSPTPPAAVRAVRDLPYLVDPAGRTWRLDVFAPSRAGGPRPVAVMLHGGGAPLLPSGTVIADLGVVVFAPPWPVVSSTDPDTFRSGMETTLGALGCAVRFARAEAASYGGDPSRVLLYGHSAGAMLASMLALAGPEVAADCPIGTGSLVPEALVLFDGDWLTIGHPMWDELLRADPSIFDLAVPWAALAGAPRLPIHLLDSADASLALSYDEAAFALRDPDGKLRRELTELGTLEDGMLSESDAQLAFLTRLRSLGYEATFDTLPGSAHMFISQAAMPIVAASFLGTCGAEACAASD